MRTGGMENEKALQVRFWGIVQAVKPRLVLAKFESETTPHSAGYIALLDGTRTAADGSGPQITGAFSVALGPAMREKRNVSTGDLLRGDAYPVPETVHDTPATLYRVGTLRTIARAGEPGGGPVPISDPPRTDPPPTTEVTEATHPRSLHPHSLREYGPCYTCPYGVLVAIVRLSDPRNYRSGRWIHAPACLGPIDCPHFVPRREA